MRVSSHLRQAFMVGIVGLVMLTSGCSTINRIGANIGLRFTESNIIPPILGNDDVQMACINGQALAPVVFATGSTGLGANNDQLMVLLESTAALCAEQTALDNELRYLRASRANQVEEAQDARIAQKRWAELAARRQYSAYQHFENYYQKKYDIQIGEGCPKFKSDFDEMVFLLGSISGIQAVVNDINSQNAVGVPKDIAAKVERSMKCLDSDKWWGVPVATRAAVWNLLPGAGTGQDPWETMKGAMRVGERKGVRLSFALYAMSAYAKADDAKLRDALKSYAATNDNQDFHVDPHFAMFDKFGDLVIMGISDRYWTEHTGSRTPAGSLGKFWDDKPTLDQGGGVQIDDLL